MRSAKLFCKCWCFHWFDKFHKIQNHLRKRLSSSLYSFYSFKISVYLVMLSFCNSSPKLNTSVEPTAYLFSLGILQSILMKLIGSLAGRWGPLRTLPGWIFYLATVMGPKFPLISVIRKLRAILWYNWIIIQCAKKNLLWFSRTLEKERLWSIERARASLPSLSRQGEWARSATWTSKKGSFSMKIVSKSLGQECKNSRSIISLRMNLWWSWRTTMKHRVLLLGSTLTK